MAEHGRVTRDPSKDGPAVAYAAGGRDADPPSQRLQPPGSRQVVGLDANERPILLLVIDTEEEFDWARPHSRTATGVTAMRHIHRVQAVCDAFELRPCYVVDYPVVNQQDGYASIKDIRDDGRCSIGAHLHPWVTPPYEEEVNSWNSYPGNLPMALEQAKLERLGEQIENVFGEPAIVYKAGRYGVGTNTGAILDALGYGVDVSPLAAFDLSGDGGPNFERFPIVPWWHDDTRRLLFVPGTAALVGVLGPAALACYRVATRRWCERLHVPGILARLRVVDRLRLSPEGYSLDEMKRLTRFLMAKGVRVFSLSFHSPSAEPGNTPYVRSAADLDAFLGRLREYFGFFFGELDGCAMSPLELRNHLKTGTM